MRERTVSLSEEMKYQKKWEHRPKILGRKWSVCLELIRGPWRLLEHIANGDEELGEMFLNDINPTEEQIHAAIRRAVIKVNEMPVFSY